MNDDRRKLIIQVEAFAWHGTQIQCDIQRDKTSLSACPAERPNTRLSNDLEVLKTTRAHVNGNPTRLGGSRIAANVDAVEGDTLARGSRETPAKRGTHDFP